MRTLKDLAKEAYDVQNACNLSGVIHSFSRGITELRAILEKEPNFSTTMLNEHPYCKLYADKIAHLAGTQYDPTMKNLDRAYSEIQKMMA